MHKDGAGPHRGLPSEDAPGPFWIVLSALSQEDSNAEPLIASLCLQPMLPEQDPPLNNMSLSTLYEGQA